MKVTKIEGYFNMFTLVFTHSSRSLFLCLRVCFEFKCKQKSKCFNMNTMFFFLVNSVSVSGKEITICGLLIRV